MHLIFQITQCFPYLFYISYQINPFTFHQRQENKKKLLSLQIFPVKFYFDYSTHLSPLRFHFTTGNDFSQNPFATIHLIRMEKTKSIEWNAGFDISLHRKFEDILLFAHFIKNEIWYYLDYGTVWPTLRVSE